VHQQKVHVHFAAEFYRPPTEPKKRAWRHGRAWKMKIRAWKNQDPCFNFYKHIFALLQKNIPFKLIVSDALRIAIKHKCIFRTLIQQK